MEVILWFEGEQIWVHVAAVKNVCALLSDIWSNSGQLLEDCVCKCASVESTDSSLWAAQEAFRSQSTVPVVMG